MRFIPPAISRKVAERALLAEKHSPTILLGAGVVSMLGSTVLACRATLKLDDVLTAIEEDKQKAVTVKNQVATGDVPEGVTYTDSEFKRDNAIIIVRGVGSIVKLYGPSLILGGIGVACLTKSHKILQDRNMALTAAYVAVDRAFQSYRERVIDRYGEDTDRELRYDSEEVTVIEEETGKALDTVRVAPGEPSGYARWFDEENPNWSPPPMDEYNWLWLRTQQNWANDMLRARGHLFLNEAYSMLGLSHTSAGSIVGWLYDRNNKRGDNYVDFGCWGKDDGQPLDFFNGREGAILLDFNVDGPIWDLMDERNAQKEMEWNAQQRRLES
jgi:Family of unknown function (DUF6353)